MSTEDPEREPLRVHIPGTLIRQVRAHAILTEQDVADVVTTALQRYLAMAMETRVPDAAPKGSVSIDSVCELFGVDPALVANAVGLKRPEKKLKKFSRHKFAFCETCKNFMVECVTCGNNCCNAGYGQVDGKNCPDCPEAHEHDKNAREYRFANTSPDLKGPCSECPADASWVDTNFAPARRYCDEHVVQDAGVRLV